MRILLLLSCLISISAFGQVVDGELKTSGRKLITKTAFVLDGHHDGWAIYDLAVDIEGNVTGAVLKESSLPSRLDNMDIRNYVVTFKFEPGTHFPKFHHADVKITMVKSENPPELEIIID